ncbi:hypothetical protein I317_06896 [Kwoniella heveanensis CBS 569]|uniref:Sm domain-containing protein n=1 Tax=Kwoniella heveanensis BCC8398 TaxID=1296120 RepID=A0A1B9GYJ7_9TREE|nr:hypothetical protein I316_01990 [Kwoniella heveanensis BCC8398]OCF39314.1 hypothetical protein I317_06896 [Kwoniella heveanensis CBS 569]
MFEPISAAASSAAGIGQYHAHEATSTSPSARAANSIEGYTHTQSFDSLRIPSTTQPAQGERTLPPILTNSTPMPTPARTPSLRDLIGQPLTLDLVDGRQIIGFLLCVDREQNIILRDAEEFRPLYPSSLMSSSSSGVSGNAIDSDAEEEYQKHRRHRWDEVRANREMYWPRSEPFGGWESGWGGRCMGMVGVKGGDVVKIQVDKALWKGIGGISDQGLEGEGEGRGCEDGQVNLSGGAGMLQPAVQGEVQMKMPVV